MFRSILAASLIATAGLIPAPANAQDPYSRMLDILSAANVQVFNGSNLADCQASDNVVPYGYYNYVRNVMVLCVNNGTEQEMKETLVHESVHVAQDCAAGGIESSELRPLGNWKSLWNELSEYHKRNITELYPVEQWGAETEARYLEQSPNTVNNILTKFCF